MDWVMKGLIGTMPPLEFWGYNRPGGSLCPGTVLSRRIESTGGLSAVSLLTDGTAGEAAGTETGCPVSDSGSRFPKDQ